MPETASGLLQRGKRVPSLRAIGCAPKLENVGASQEGLRRPTRQLRAVVLELGGEDGAALGVQTLPPVDAGELSS